MYTPVSTLVAIEIDLSGYHTVRYYCVYRDCYGLFPLKTIYKHFVHFHSQFEVDFTFNDIKVKNV